MLMSCLYWQIRGQLNHSTTEFQDLSSQLEESTCMLTVLEKLVQIHDNQKIIDQAINREEYTVAADSINAVETLLENPINERESEIKILSVLKASTCVQKERLMRDIRESWSKYVKWEIPQEQNVRKSGKAGSVSLIISSSKHARNVLENGTQAMHNMGILEPQLKVFGNRLMGHLIKPVVLKKAKVDTSTKGDTVILQIVQKKKKDGKQEGLQDVFAKLTGMLEFINQYLLSIEIQQKSEDGSDKKIMLMQKVAYLISQEALDFFIEECLAPSIPSNSQELDKYSQVIAYTERFHESLIKFKFISAENTGLLDYVNNVQVLFANKKCREILDKARDFMRSDLHNTVQVSAEKPQGDLPCLAEAGSKSKKMKTAENMVLPTNITLHENTFRMPTCLIR